MTRTNILKTDTHGPTGTLETSSYHSGLRKSNFLKVFLGVTLFTSTARPISPKIYKILGFFSGKFSIKVPLWILVFFFFLSYSNTTFLSVFQLFCYLYSILCPEKIYFIFTILFEVKLQDKIRIVIAFCKMSNIEIRH